jgi:hypothetical protein
MNGMLPYKTYLPEPLHHIPWREHTLDGKLLLFDRDTGLNVLLEGEETAHFTRHAPRTLLIAVTNACNLTCHFCYRDLESRSLWRYDTLLQFCQEADRWGVLEVAFGGGEPMLFPRWAEFIRELYTTTHLCINFTTNGMLLTEGFLRQIEGCYGQIRVSLHEDNHPHETLTLLTKMKAGFGVNWLITPAELPTLKTKFTELLRLGVRDFLFLGYKGTEHDMHLSREDRERFSAFINQAHQHLGGAVQMKLDVCWGDSLPDIPRLFVADDCGAGDEFLSITSDKHVKDCSFGKSASGIPFDTVEDLRNIWMGRRTSRQAAQIGGCTRLPDRGLGGGHSAYIDVAAIR